MNTHPYPTDEECVLCQNEKLQLQLNNTLEEIKLQDMIIKLQKTMIDNYIELNASLQQIIAATRSSKENLGRVRNDDGHPVAPSDRSAVQS
jgi:hypothetical protein